jgi:glycosyltransferase involved in cell wall biosynthesis
MSQATPLVSLCVPTYRRAAFIGETLTSALCQTVDDFEIIVVDDVSPDNTAEVVAGFTDSRIRYIRNERNRGVPENLNYALSLARGEFMLILEDHDILEPTYLEETLAVMRCQPSVGFVASGLITIDEQGQSLQRFVEPWPELLTGRWLLRRLLTRTDCPFSVTTLIRRSAAEGLEPLLDAKYGWYADQYLWLRLAAKSDFGYVAKPLLRFREREAGHYLAEQFWESVLCVDRIHQDTWLLLHPRPSVRAYLDRSKYEVAKLKQIAGMRAGKLLRGEDWAVADRDNTRYYLLATGHWLLAAMGLVPVPVWTVVRRRWKLSQQRRLSTNTAANPVQRIT